MITSLVDTLEGPAHTVRAAPGDWGIDVFVGDLTDRVLIWQAKYFIDKIGGSQVNNIRSSFTRACAEASDRGYRIDAWTLCIPVDLDGPSHQRWERWRAKQTRETGIPIELWSADRLRTLLMDPRCDGIRSYYYGQSAPRPTASVPSRLLLRPDDEVVDVTTADAVGWRGGLELRLGDASYLLHDPVARWTAPDRALVRCEAGGQELKPAPRPVRIRHLQVRRRTDEARRWIVGLRRQADLMEQLGGQSGLPVLYARHGLGAGIEAHGGAATLVMSAPVGRSWREVHGRASTRAGADRLAAAAILADAVALCRTIETLHQHGHAHLALTADDVLLTTPARGGARTAALRDLGLAGLPTAQPHQAGGTDGAPPAPEQRVRHRFGPGPQARPGPAADVYQIAVLVRAALGHPLAVPSPGAPAIPPPPEPPGHGAPGPGLPSSGLPGSGLPADLDDLLARALASDPQRRPRIDVLAAGLRDARHRLSVGPRPDQQREARS
ncbi:hypothetical protein [Frankia sp. AgB32]|uniref:hypothetical protein n=1 Tax=Frankia sp. AgB32 TaxID=631119 RepID=UPI00200EA673|nr:hypothetical protein [Frankia sp. AgB32]MCK9897300.1 hypothetical protein [Frankia sp. AgB32]